MEHRCQPRSIADFALLPAASCRRTQKPAPTVAPIATVITDPPRACLIASEWTCLNKQCIRASLHCDGFADCADESDEFACSRPAASAIEATASASSTPLIVMAILVGIVLAGLLMFAGYRGWRAKNEGLPTSSKISSGIMLTSLKSVNTQSQL